MTLITFSSSEISWYTLSKSISIQNWQKRKKPAKIYTNSKMSNLFLWFSDFNANLVRTHFGRNTLDCIVKNRFKKRIQVESLYFSNLQSISIPFSGTYELVIKSFYRNHLSLRHPSHFQVFHLSKHKTDNKWKNPF